MAKKKVEAVEAEVEAPQIEVEESKPSKKKKEKKAKPIWHIRNIHNVTAENDIKFRGPLSYRHLRIIAWVFLAIAQIGLLLKFNITLGKDPALFGRWPSFLSGFSSLMSPLFLIAAFSVVINAKDGYRRLIILYVGLSLMIFALFALVYLHYIVGTVALTMGYAAAFQNMESMFHAITSNGFLAFNIFIDLLLCTLVTFFINYQPKKYFQGKKIYIFRALVALPLLYEIASIGLKIASSFNKISLPVLVYPLLTTKAPVAFLIFVAMALFIKFREKHFLKNGKTHEQYIEFQKSNVNCLHFNIFLSISIVIAAIIDLLLLLFLSIAAIKGLIPIDIIETATEEDVISIIEKAFSAVQSWGFGNVFIMILIIPIIIFFDYRKTHDDKITDTIIPVVGIGLLAVIYLEGGYESIKEYLAQIIKEGQEPTPEPALLGKIVRFTKNLIGR